MFRDVGILLADEVVMVLNPLTPVLLRHDLTPFVVDDAIVAGMCFTLTGCLADDKGLEMSEMVSVVSAICRELIALSLRQVGPLSDAATVVLASNADTLSGALRLFAND